jgi:menaquinone-dependent protoporphyrinogen oxidase
MFRMNLVRSDKEQQKGVEIVNVLLAYATAHGSTAEIGERIGDILRAAGVNVVVARIQDIQRIDGYDAFIFGSAIHGGTWLPELTTFLRKSLDEIGKKPVYFWISCIRVMEHDGLQHVMDYYMIPEIMSELNVREKTAFAGKLDLDNVDWNERWTLAARYDGSTWPNNFVGDFRDWKKIADWGTAVTEDILQLQSAKTAS